MVLAFTLIRQTMDQPGIGVEVKENGFVICEDGAEFVVGETMRMRPFGHQFEEADDVYKADFQEGEMFAKEGCGGKGFVRRHVAARRHYDVGFAVLVVGSPVPDSKALCAVGDCLLHVEVLEVFLLVGDDDVDIVRAAETVIHYGEQTIAVWREVNADYFRTFVCNNVEEAGVLMREAVMVLSPNCGCEEDVEGPL